ncbi:hypothetical protein [uncultured Microscilla sp.]|uniref:hypothetical protein n=1 Tax=uncultured Microscilla sp. TaxID=432653 RepID=UPI002633CE4B|nr:hypothetical protein [uncultured Microscilla sp.]
MARSVGEILGEMLAEKAKTPELDSLNSDSKTAVWRLLFYVFAVAIHTLEVLLDHFKGDVYTAIEKNQPGTLPWYTKKAEDFQLNDLLNDNLGYNSINPELQIIRYASAKENILGGVTLKVAKQDGFLNTEELKQFTAYMERVKFAGVQISYISMLADNLTVDMEVFYSPLINEAVIRNLVKNTISEYLENIGFDGVLRVNDLIASLRSLHEVLDVKLNQVESMQGFNATVVDLDHIAVSGRFAFDANNSIIQLTAVQ